MKTFTSHEEALDFLLAEDKACNFARAAINIFSKEWPEHRTFNEIEILMAYEAVEAIMSFDGKIIYVNGTAMFDIGGHPLTH